MYLLWQQIQVKDPPHVQCHHRHPRSLKSTFIFVLSNIKPQSTRRNTVENQEKQIRMKLSVNGIDISKVTHAATTDLEDVLNPKESKPVMPMKGFDPEFVDIVDYILRITYWIWHEKKVDLCLKYYSSESILHTMTGDILGNEPVVTNTWATLKVFPDRTLDGENVVWSVEEGESTYYTSHLIVSRMTNEGDSEWGPATNIRARIRTIADCVCKNNVIIEEWLMRDNALLVMTLGFDLKETAQKQAVADQEKGFNLLEFLAPERERVLSTAARNAQEDIIVPAPETDPTSFVKALFRTLWEKGAIDQCGMFYDFRVGAHLMAGRELYGTLEYQEYLAEIQGGLTDIVVSVDHIACIPYLGEAIDIAVRWTLVGTHSADSELYGEATNVPLYILASSHFRITGGKIREEWTVFDELALHRQVATARL